jgi:hypothetical protein
LVPVWTLLSANISLRQSRVEVYAVNCYVARSVRLGGCSSVMSKPAPHGLRSARWEELVRNPE